MAFLNAENSALYYDLGFIVRGNAFVIAKMG